jgi:hypothetical protein
MKNRNVKKNWTLQICQNFLKSADLYLVAIRLENIQLFNVMDLRDNAGVPMKRELKFRGQDLSQEIHLQLVIAVSLTSYNLQLNKS